MRKVGDLSPTFPLKRATRVQVRNALCQFSSRRVGMHHALPVCAMACRFASRRVGMHRAVSVLVVLRQLVGLHKAVWPVILGLSLDLAQAEYRGDDSGSEE